MNNSAFPRPDAKPPALMVTRQNKARWSAWVRPDACWAGDLWDLVEKLDEDRKAQAQARRSQEKLDAARQESLAARGGAMEGGGADLRPGEGVAGAGPGQGPQGRPDNPGKEKG